VKSCRSLRADAARIWKEALRASDPAAAMRKLLNREGTLLNIAGRCIDLARFRKVWILGAGKAAAPMARAAEQMLGNRIAGGFLVTKYGHSLPLKRAEIVEAGHPLPDSGSAAAGRRMLSFARECICEDDLVFCLFSGGASALLVSPAPGITLRDKISCTRLLQDSGADIYQMNAVRKHLSAIKGGGLARVLAPARAVSLILSDVVGDDIATIASGPTAPDPTTFEDCIDILKGLNLLGRVPRNVRKLLDLGRSGYLEETPKEGDPVFRNIDSFIAGSNAQTCTVAAETAKRLGYNSMVLTSRLDGDNAAAARLHMNIAAKIGAHDRPLRRPACIISGGETTVKITGKGKGGRNQEFVLHCVRPLAELSSPCVVASVATDGTDGPTDAAGAVADNETLGRCREIGTDFLDESLKRNDSYRFFQQLGDLVIIGPTRTNVMDLHIVLLSC